MVLAIVGGFVLALGLFSGGALVAAPLGLAPGADSFTLWVLFPVFSLLGYALLAVGARVSSMRLVTLAASGLLLVLALASATALVLDAADIVHRVGNTLPLWYVLIVAGLLGAVGAAATGRTEAPAVQPVAR